MTSPYLIESARRAALPIHVGIGPITNRYFVYQHGGAGPVTVTHGFRKATAAYLALVERMSGERA